MATRAVALVALLVATGCVNAPPFFCQGDVECGAPGSGAECQPDGFCSFPDPGCDSGQRYGELAGDSAADQCVPSSASEGGAPASDNPGPDDPRPGDPGPGDPGPGDPDGPDGPDDPRSGCFTELRAGGDHSCALRQDGAVFCWGDNRFGQLGRARPTERGPVQVELKAAVAVAAGGQHSCALLATGEIRCWGRNSRGQLGDGTRRGSETPVTVAGIGDGASLELGEVHSCAVTDRGLALCWGGNSHGQLGRRTLGDGPLAAPVSTPAVSITGLATGGHGQHSCAFTREGAFLCWGRGSQGQLGNGGPIGGDPLPDSDGPISVAAFAGVWRLAVGREHTCGSFPGGNIRCTGANERGQLGDGTFARRTRPVDIAGPPAIAVAAGQAHTCALSVLGSVYCWGNNARSQLGLPGREPRPAAAAAVAGLPAAADIAAGGSHTCALSRDGLVACWGDGFWGQLGPDRRESSAQPIPVELPCE